MLAKRFTYENYDYQYEERPYIHEIPPVYENSRQAARPACNTVMRRRAGVLVFLILSFMFVMTVRSELYTQKAYELGNIQKEEGILIKNNDHLQVRLAALRSPERITALASDLGMVSADKNIYVKAPAAVDGAATANPAATRVAMKKD